MQKFAFFLWFLVLMGCSDPKTRPETADKLKPLLVMINPSDVPLKPWKVPVAGEDVTLQFHFIGPPDLGPLTLTAGEVEPQPLTIPFNNWTIATPAAYVYPGLRHVTIDAFATLPTAAELSALWSGFSNVGFVRLRYTLVVSDGSRQLPVVGDFIVYQDAAFPGAQETLFAASIDSPAEGELVAGSKIPIVSSFSNTRDEPVKIGWYVSAGEIKNRRAASTEWELPGAGEFTLIFTIRGKESRNGDIQIRKVVLP